MADRASHRPTRSADSGRNWREPLAFLSGRRAVSDAQRWPPFGALFSLCGAATARLSRQHLEHVTVRISKVKTAAAATVVDLHIVERARAAAVSDALGSHAIEDAVELRLIDFEGIMVTLEIRVVVEIEGQRVIDPQRRKVRERTFVAQAQDAGEEACRCLLVM